jgi:hypothetical protein
MEIRSVDLLAFIALGGTWLFLGAFLFALVKWLRRRAAD